MNKLKFFYLFFYLLFSALYGSPILVFDFGDVIARADKNIMTDSLACSLHVSRETAQHIYTKWHQYNEEIETGSCSQQKLPFSPECIHILLQAYRSALTPIPGMMSLVEHLKQEGYQVAMLSNTTYLHSKIIEEQGYYHHFCPVLLSWEIGMKKPQKKAYEFLLKTLNIRPSDCIFIDDKRENIEAAKELGITSIQFHSKDQLVQELISLGILK